MSNDREEYQLLKELPDSVGGRDERLGLLEGDFAAHSLRAGFVTSGAERGIAEVSLQNITGHRSAMILRGYVRRATLFDDAPLPRILGDA